jgi:hypothetical protein
MHSICTYRIEIQGQLEENDFNKMSPHRIADVCQDSAVTQFVVFTDQSGLIGLIRYLHEQNFVLSFIYRDTDEIVFQKEDSNRE